MSSTANSSASNGQQPKNFDVTELVGTYNASTGFGNINGRLTVNDSYYDIIVDPSDPEKKKLKAEYNDAATKSTTALSKANSNGASEYFTQENPLLVSSAVSDGTTSAAPAVSDGTTSAVSDGTTSAVSDGTTSAVSDGTTSAVSDGTTSAAKAFKFSAKGSAKDSPSYKGPTESSLAKRGPNNNRASVNRASASDIVKQIQNNSDLKNIFQIKSSTQKGGKRQSKKNKRKHLSKSRRSIRYKKR
jgi:hypothetical protein